VAPALRSEGHRPGYELHAVEIDQPRRGTCRPMLLGPTSLILPLMAMSLTLASSALPSASPVSEKAEDMMCTFSAPMATQSSRTPGRTAPGRRP